MHVDGPAMPGEAEPLAYEPGRGPVTKDEVLGNMRRRQRIKNMDQPRERQVSLAESLPDITGEKTPVGIRLPTVLVEYMHLIALLENLPLIAVIEAALMHKALSAPSPPEQAKESYLGLQELLSGDDRPLQKQGDDLDLRRLRAKARDLLATIDKLEGRSSG
ncbi:hypothetical protein [Catellatospora bangladeshensis]|uniref:Uncharacterized protein n=1 Tax=Catellatospora bangladeshensis TaxID=310355 RepID=A0A8J3JK19_9ACTN|nr:hypothetical protein [Catellatospora bangladeshensis]GIF82096.1 hypothetical protein Cba03nite_34450 [Catellatospora bangladeshensis]